MSKPIIYLDLDGVIVDFVRSFFDLFGIDYAVFHNWPVQVGGGIHKLLPVKSEKEMWEIIHNKTSIEWWANLLPYPWMPPFYRKLSEIGKVILCTAGSYDPNAFTGKYLWMKSYFGSGFEDYVFTPQKHLLAHPWAADNKWGMDRYIILIDDYGKNIDEFEAAGGIGILFSRPWNSGGGTDGWLEAERILDELNSLTQ